MMVHDKHQVDESVIYVITMLFKSKNILLLIAIYVIKKRTLNTEMFRKLTEALPTCSLVKSSEGLITIPLTPTQKIFGRLISIVELLLKIDFHIISDGQ